MHERERIDGRDAVPPRRHQCDEQGERRGSEAPRKPQQSFAPDLARHGPGERRHRQHDRDEGQVLQADGEGQGDQPARERPAPAAGGIERVEGRGHDQRQEHDLG